MGDFHLNLRCADIWALVAMLRLLPPWVRAWTIYYLHALAFFLYLYEVVLVVWVLLLLLTRRAEFKVPWVYQGCFK